MTDSPRIAAAKELIVQIESALAAAGLTKVTVTLDFGKVESGARHGIVLVTPPTLTSSNFAEITPQWDVHIVAGPSDNYLAAWGRIDTILQALFDAQLNIERAEPDSYAAKNTQAPLPAYTITLNE